MRKFTLALGLTTCLINGNVAYAAGGMMRYEEMPERRWVQPRNLGGSFSQKLGDLLPILDKSLRPAPLVRDKLKDLLLVLDPAKPTLPSSPPPPMPVLMPSPAVHASKLAPKDLLSVLRQSPTYSLKDLIGIMSKQLSIHAGQSSSVSKSASSSTFVRTGRSEPTADRGPLDQSSAVSKSQSPYLVVEIARSAPTSDPKFSDISWSVVRPDLEKELMAIKVTGRTNLEAKGKELRRKAKRLKDAEKQKTQSPQELEQERAILYKDANDLIVTIEAHQAALNNKVRGAMAKKANTSPLGDDVETLSLAQLQGLISGAPTERASSQGRHSTEAPRQAPLQVTGPALGPVQAVAPQNTQTAISMPGAGLLRMTGAAGLTSASDLAPREGFGNSTRGALPRGGAGSVTPMRVPQLVAGQVSVVNGQEPTLHNDNPLETQLDAEFEVEAVRETPTKLIVVCSPSKRKSASNTRAIGARESAHQNLFGAQQDTNGPQAQAAQRQPSPGGVLGLARDPLARTLFGDDEEDDSLAPTEVEQQNQFVHSNGAAPAQAAPQPAGVPTNVPPLTGAFEGPLPASVPGSLEGDDLELALTQYLADVGGIAGSLSPIPEGRAELPSRPLSPIDSDDEEEDNIRRASLAPLPPSSVVEPIGDPQLAALLEGIDRLEPISLPATPSVSRTGTAQTPVTPVQFRATPPSAGARNTQSGSAGSFVARMSGSLNRAAASVRRFVSPQKVRSPQTTGLNAGPIAPPSSPATAAAPAPAPAVVLGQAPSAAAAASSAVLRTPVRVPEPLPAGASRSDIMRTVREWIAYGQQSPNLERHPDPKAPPLLKPSAQNPREWMRAWIEHIRATQTP